MTAGLDNSTQEGAFAGKTGLWSGIALGILILVAAPRIIATYSVFNETYDEGYHVACGMEWLDKGVFSTYDPQHPPLGRVTMALGPFFRGVRSFSLNQLEDEGNAILHAN